VTPAQAAKIATFPDLNARGVFSYGGRVSRVLYWRKWVAAEVVPDVAWRETRWYAILVDGGTLSLWGTTPESPGREGITLATLTDRGIRWRQHRAKCPAHRRPSAIRRCKVSDALPF
jgi:hypothetical protein